MDRAAGGDEVRPDEVVVLNDLSGGQARSIRYSMSVRRRPGFEASGRAGPHRRVNAEVGRPSKGFRAFGPQLWGILSYALGNRRYRLF